MEYETPTVQNCRELYAVVDLDTGRIHFGSNGSAYKNIRTATNKLNSLREHGDHFEIITYYLGGNFSISKDDLMDFLEG